MKELNYYARINKYYEQHALSSMAIEVKITKTGRLPFSCLADHQEQALLQAERTIAYKIADTGYAKKPWDIVVLHRAIPIIVAVFYSPQKTSIYEIPIRNFIFERERSKMKSVSQARAEMIATKKILAIQL